MIGFYLWIADVNGVKVRTFVSCILKSRTRDKIQEPFNGCINIVTDIIILRPFSVLVCSITLLQCFTQDAKNMNTGSSAENVISFSTYSSLKILTTKISLEGMHYG